MLPDNQVRFLLATLFSAPLSFFLRYIPSYNQRRFYSITTATILQFYVFSNQLWLVFLLHTLIYLFILLKGRKSGALVTMGSILILSIYHIYRMIVNYGGWDIDLSTMLMLNISKYSLFAYAYQDGGVPLDKIKYQHRKNDRLEKLPSFIDYLGYCQFLPTGVLPTPLEYMRYFNYMNKIQQFAQIPVLESIKKAAFDLVIALGCVIPYLIHVFYFPLGYMKTNDFLNSGLFNVIIYSFLSVWLIKFKYYFGWNYCQIPVHLSGVSYQPNKNIQDQFLGIQSCDPWQVESTVHLRNKITYWNMAVQQWLRKCIYQRLPFSKATAGMITFMVSAFWHGFYEGYYFTFVLWFLQMHVAGLIFKWSRNQNSKIMKFYKQNQRFAYVIIWIFWNFMFVHIGLYFQLLDYQTCLKLLAYFRYFSPIVLLTLLIIFTFFGGHKSNPSKSQKSQSTNVKDKNQKDALATKEQ